MDIDEWVNAAQACQEALRMKRRTARTQRVRRQIRRRGVSRSPDEAQAVELHPIAPHLPPL